MLCVAVSTGGTRGRRSSVGGRKVAAAVGGGSAAAGGAHVRISEQQRGTGS